MIDKNQYFNIHMWLRNHYGPADHCDNPRCSGKSKNFQWALLKDKEYAKNRAHFIQLCVSCHIKYDRKESGPWMKGRRHTELSKKKMSFSRKGKPISDEHRLAIKIGCIKSGPKISAALRGRKISDDHREALKRRKISDETRIKLRDSALKQWANKKI